MKAQIYGQMFEHQEVFIIADAEALSAIMEACAAAFYKRENTRVSMMANDGEWYDLHIICLDTTDYRWNKLEGHYIGIDEDFDDEGPLLTRGDGKISPEDLAYLPQPTKSR